MSEILVMRRIGSYRGGEIVTSDVDEFWRRHIDAGNARVLGEDADGGPSEDEDTAEGEGDSDSWESWGE